LVGFNIISIFIIQTIIFDIKNILTRPKE